MPDALHFLVLTVAGWVNRYQEDQIEYLREENRILREQLGGRRLRLTDAQRRRLTVRGQKLGRRPPQLPSGHERPVGTAHVVIFRFALRTGVGSSRSDVIEEVRNDRSGIGRRSQNTIDQQFHRKEIMAGPETLRAVS